MARKHDIKAMEHAEIAETLLRQGGGDVVIARAHAHATLAVAYSNMSVADKPLGP